jgi:hypothetical protein
VLAILQNRIPRGESPQNTSSCYNGHLTSKKQVLDENKIAFFDDIAKKDRTVVHRAVKLFGYLHSN